MKKLRHNFNRNCRLDRIAENDVFRPQFSCIYFKDGYAYATDAHILIKAKLTDVSTFQDDQIDLLNGKCIHRSVYSRLLEFERVQITSEGFKARILDIDSFITFGFTGVQKDVVSDIEKVILNAQNDKQEEITTFGINPVLLARLDKIFNDNYGVQLIVKAANKPILVKWDGKDAIGLIMPVMINY